MNTALNLMNSPADSAAISSPGAAPADKRSVAIDGGKSQGESPFAAMLKKESTGGSAKTDQAGNPARADKSAKAADDQDKNVSEKDASDTAQTSTSEVAEGQETQSTNPPEDLLPGMETSGNTAISLAPLPSTVDGKDPALAGSEQSFTVLTAAHAGDSSEPSDAVSRSQARAGLVVPGDTVAASALSPATNAAAGDAPLDQASEAAKPLVITRIHQGQIFSPADAMATAGKTLPPGGKALPAGVFFNSEGSDETELQFSHGAQTTESFDAVSRNAGKQHTGLGVEFNADNLLRSLVTGKAGQSPISADASPLAAQPGSSAGNETTAPPLLNPSLQVSADRALTGSRSPLLPGLEASTQFTITAEAGSSEWGNQLSSRIRWMGNLNLSSAELKLHPAELGTVEIQITTEDDQTRVSFVTSNAAAKEVIENSLPRLRDLLSDGGLQLQQGDVAHKEAGDDKASGNSQAGSGVSGDEERAPEESMLHVSRKSTSQIDHYV